ncbi:leucyl/phenylalanyl-tRNA--protein transferase [Chryseobacterium sp. A321]
MVSLKKEEIGFPDPREYHPLGGLIAMGGDLSSERLWLGYNLGLFPWFNPGEEILWWCPDPRFVLFPKNLYVSKSMKKVLNSNQFTFTKDQAFEEVMRACMEVPRVDQDGTWISEELISGFLELHQQGKATSIEVWQGDTLVGGFYGVVVGNVFCGESMFSKVSNASKAAFITFVQSNQGNYKLIDCQIHSNHLETFGAEMISKKEYLEILFESNGL